MEALISKSGIALNRPTLLRLRRVFSFLEFDLSLRLRFLKNYIWSVSKADSLEL